MLVLATMFIGGSADIAFKKITIAPVSSTLPTTSYLKMVEIWLIFNLFIPFGEVLLHTYMDTLRYIKTSGHNGTRLS